MFFFFFLFSNRYNFIATDVSISFNLLKKVHKFYSIPKRRVLIIAFLLNKDLKAVLTLI